MKKFVNLLPPEEQKQLKLQELNRELLSFAFWLGLSFLVFIALLYAGRVFLRSELAATTQQVAAETTALTDLQEAGLPAEVEKFNLNLANFRTLTAKHETLAPVLLELAQLLPPDLTLSSLSLERKSRKVEIAGRAGSRKSVLILRRNLLTSPSFSNVNFPLSNLEKATDLPFSYRFYLKPNSPAQ